MSTTYIVVSDNCVLGSRGTTVTGEQIEGCNIAALIEGGHLIEPKPKPDPKPDPESPLAIPATETKEQ